MSRIKYMFITGDDIVLHDRIEGETWPRAVIATPEEIEAADFIIMVAPHSCTENSRGVYMQAMKMRYEELMLNHTEGFSQGGILDT